MSAAWKQLCAALAEVGRVASTFRILPREDGCLENTIYDPRSGSSNWIAMAEPDRSRAGGLRRAFWKHGSKGWYLGSAEPGDMIEFGGDGRSKRGKVAWDRRYFLVMAVHDDRYVVLPLGEKVPGKRDLAAMRSTYGVAKDGMPA